MILLDTDTLTLLFQGHPRVLSRMRSADQDVATTWAASQKRPWQRGHSLGERQRGGTTANDIAVPRAPRVFVQKRKHMAGVLACGALGPLHFDGDEPPAARDDEIHFRANTARHDL